MTAKVATDWEKEFFALFNVDVHLPGTWDKQDILRAIRKKKQEIKDLENTMGSPEWIKSKFQAKFPEIVNGFVAYIKNEYSFDQKIQNRVKTMLEYTVPGGKQYRGNLVISSLKAFSKGGKLDHEIWERAFILGWCIEFLQASLLIADDIMDESTTRRNKLCWYKLPNVNMDAIDDAYLVESVVYYLIKKYFFSSPSLYIKLMDLYHEVLMVTELGQLLDLVTAPQTKTEASLLENFNMYTYKQIVCHKTAYYTFYLPIVSAMILCGADKPKDLKTVKALCMAIGEKFQIQDDYLDCYADPEVLGKIGTDIQDFKCSWLMVQALLLMSKSQRKLVEEHYGKNNKESIAIIKRLYTSLGLQDLFKKQEEDSKAHVEALITKHPHLPKSLFLGILNKIHNRKK